MKKIISLALSCILLLSSCGTKPVVENQVESNDNQVIETQVEKLDVKVVMPYGTPSLSAVKLIVETPEFDENIIVEYETLESADVLSTTLVNKEADIAIVPTNLAANLYNKELGYQIAGTGVWGNFYIVSSEEINSIEDLKGKNIDATGRNLTPDAVLRYVLTNNGIDPDNDLTIEYFAGASEMATNFITNVSNTASAPQPVLTNMLIKREDAKVVIDLQEEWSKITGFDNYPQASLIISSELIEENPEFVNKFIEEYSNSVVWVNENPKEAGEYYESLNIGLNATIIEKAIPSSSLNFVSANDAKDSINEYLTVLFEFNPKLIGEKMVDDGLYFQK